MSKQLTPDEAREHMAKGGIVKDMRKKKYRMQQGVIQKRFRTGWSSVHESYFMDNAPFTIHLTRKELEQRVVELDAEQVINEGVINMAAESLDEALTQIAAVTAERDALASRVAWLEALVPEEKS